MKSEPASENTDENRRLIRLSPPVYLMMTVRAAGDRLLRLTAHLVSVA